MRLASTIVMNFAMTCKECDFTSNDIYLMKNHNCDIADFGGQCEDFPCCGHESGDCNGLLYGSDEAIQSDPHLLCDHETGTCEVADNWDEDDDWGNEDIRDSWSAEDELYAEYYTPSN